MVRWMRLATCLGLLTAGLGAAPFSPGAGSPEATIALSPASAVVLKPGAGVLSGTASALSGTASALSGTASALSPSADVLLPLPPRPPPPAKTHNSALESFVGVTLLSAPFTAFWAVLGALAVESVAQHQFPPDFGQDRAKATLSAAGAVAGGSSVMIGLVSIHWGGPSGDEGLSPTVQAGGPAALSPTSRP